MLGAGRAMTKTNLRERCKLVLGQIQRDAVLRQGSPLDTLFEFVSREVAASGNYTASHDTFPTEVIFANGRIVRVADDGEYLVVSKLEAS